MKRQARALALCVLLAGAACVPPQAEDDLIRDFDPETTVMGQVQTAGVLRVGVPNDGNGGGPWFFQEGEIGEADADDVVGYGPDFAELVAGRLGVETEVTAAPSEDLLEMLEDDSIDLAFPLIPITEKTVRRNSFTDPYFVVHQRLLGPPGVDGLADLDGATVCRSHFEETSIDPAELNPSVDSVGGFCFGGLLEAQVEAVSGPSVLLIAEVMQIEDLCEQNPARWERVLREAHERLCEGTGSAYSISGDQLTTEGLGAAVERGASGWLEFVNGVLSEAKRDGEWAAIYGRYLEPYLGPAEPPDITVEEAAALYPSDL
jgi:polar amino acid transport system substrate-binding protein